VIAGPAEESAKPHRLFRWTIIGDQHRCPRQHQRADDESGGKPPRDVDGEGSGDDAHRAHTHHHQVSLASTVEFDITAQPGLGDEDRMVWVLPNRAHTLIVPPLRACRRRRQDTMRHHDQVPVPTIVLLHGQPDSSASFWPLRHELRSRLQAGVRVVAPDRPGYGANMLAATDYAGNVRWLRRWLGHINAGPIILVGHSWAGGVAALAAARDTSPIAGLVLLASIGPSCLVRIDPVLAAPILGEAIAFSTLRIGRPLIRRRAGSLIAAHLSAADTPHAWASGMAMQHRPVWRSFLTEQRALLRELPAITSALSTIEAPTRVLSGTRDTVIPAQTPTALVKAIRGASRVDIDGGHDLQLRQPREVAESVSDFAAELLDGR
jgi:pimeloyl-ACP methyl ester carboxylesterase